MADSAGPDGGLTMHRAGSGEPLLLIHGLGLTWRCWKPVLPGLEAVHDTIAIDLPGFGDAAPLDARPTVAALADAVEGEIDRLGLDTPHLAGNSLGGWVAFELARRGRARSVVAFAPSGLELPPERAYVASLNVGMRARARAAAPVAGAVAARAVSRSALLAPMRARPWRVPAADGAAEIRAFGRSPAFHPTLRWRSSGSPLAEAGPERPPGHGLRPPDPAGDDEPGRRPGRLPGGRGTGGRRPRTRLTREKRGAEVRATPDAPPPGRGDARSRPQRAKRVSDVREDRRRCRRP